jgi:hypothetical protein
MTDPLPSPRARAALSLALSAVVAAQLFVWTPMALHAGNAGEFVTPLAEMLAHYALPALALVVLGSIAGVALRHEDFAPFTAALAIVAILLWAQANLLVWDYGVFDGREIDWGRARWRGFVDLGLWVAALVLAVWQHRRVARAATFGAFALAGLQLATTLVTLAVRAPEPRRTVVTETRELLRELPRFSTRHNVLHIIADGFQSDVFADLVAPGAKDRARLVAGLDGFTFFDRNLGAFPYTHLSIPAFLSGRAYRNEMPLARYFDEALGERSVLRAARDAGWDVELVVPPIVARVYAHAEATRTYAAPEALHLGAASQARREAMRLLDLVLFRSVPHFLKRGVYDHQVWLLQGLFSDAKFGGLSVFAHIDLLHRLAERVAADRERPVYRVLHLLLVHPPFVADASCAYPGETLPAERVNVQNQARCAMYGVVALFDAMRRAGVYDNTTIVLMADHGSWVQPAMVGPVGTNVPSPIGMGLPLPLLAIKPAGARGPLATSHAPTANVDVPATVAKLAGFATAVPGTSVYELSPDAPRTRYFAHYMSDLEEYDAEFLPPLTEFEVVGSPFDGASWRRGARYLPGGAVERHGP